jgi:hypothetical protein
MMKTSRIAVIVLLAGALLPAAASAQPRPAIAEQIAKTYGIDSWGQVEALRYTFHIDAGPKLKLARSWIWEPKTGQVTYEGPDKAGKPIKVTYSRAQLATQPDAVKNEIEPAFFNDQYNLLFQFHLIWDAGATVEDAGMAKLPLGKGKARKVVTKYPSAGGFTPGDTWELYVEPSGRIKELFFRHGGSAKPSVFVAAYLDHKKAGPLLFALNHKGKADGKAARVFFTNVAVKLTGSDAWVEAK